jgi:16S rRNA (adenine1518-N6/adenine1519-N6)-dimethyltransferase
VQPPLHERRSGLRGLVSEPTAKGLLGAGDVRALAAELGLRPTKKWGQNFVVDPNTVERIVRAARLTKDDVVLEVGPGLGSLTLALLPKAQRVIAVEIDPALADRLPRTVAERRPDLASRLVVMHADALRLAAIPGGPTALVANLPYNVAVPVVLHLLAVVPTLHTVLVMVQKEVADRLVADPGGRVYGVPSVKARWYCDVEAAGNIGTTVFWPVPHVESGLVRMTRRTPPSSRVGRDATFAVVDAAFSQRRKTLRAALAGIAGGPANAEVALRAAGLDPSTRGEQLDVEQFARLADALDGGRASPSESE